MGTGSLRPLSIYTRSRSSAIRRTGDSNSRLRRIFCGGDKITQLHRDGAKIGQFVSHAILSLQPEASIRGE